MYSDLIHQLDLGANGLPYSIPIHPNLVHLTLGCSSLALLSILSVYFLLLSVPFFKYLAIPATRSNFFDVGWYNMVAASIITFFTVAAGFYEMLLMDAPSEVKSAWNFTAIDTMIWHGIGGVLLLALIVGMTVWRGFQRYVWRSDRSRQVQWWYLLAGLVIMFVMYIHGTLGAQLAAEFGAHNTAGHLLRLGEDPNVLLR